MPATVATSFVEQVGRHRDHGHRQRLVREAAQAQQRDRDVGALDEARRRPPPSSARADRERAAARVDQTDAACFCSAMRDHAAEHAAEIGREKRHPGEQRDLLQIEMAHGGQDKAAARTSACPRSGSARNRGRAMPQKLRCSRIFKIDGRVPSPCKCLLLAGGDVVALLVRQRRMLVGRLVEHEPQRHPDQADAAGDHERRLPVVVQDRPRRPAAARASSRPTRRC